jgi:hypothetical protein
MHPNSPRRHAHDRRESRDILGHDGSGADHGMSAYSYAFENCGMGSNPNIVFQDHRRSYHTLISQAASLISSVIPIRDVAKRPNHAVWADLNLLMGIDHCVAIDVASLPN